ncbi:MAG: hypothetical protein A3F09_04145 [Chlamydiae bacterium RIFCSPHIGHO2_12_FULL_49_11]|nr:MAG: hypothetical protein A3F09_04145 [Chlamydiae bacterium RIFCSPHIGHO2_12_FULL_49_11]
MDVKTKELQNLQSVIAHQTQMEDSMQEMSERGMFWNAIRDRSKTIDERRRNEYVSSKGKLVGEEDVRRIEGNEASDSLAQEFHQKNEELDPRTLVSLRAYIQEEDDPETIIHKLLQVYPDRYLADEALEYLIRSTSPERKVYPNLLKAKELLNDRFGIEIRAGRNMSREAQTFSRQGLGTPTALRDLYRDIIQNPREPHDLFEELNTKFNFEQMKVVLSFLLHSVGADLKSKGPSIAKEELMNIFHETRVMQAILGVYRFFFSRTGMIQNEFTRKSLEMTPLINFINLSKRFMVFIKDRYPAPDKAISMTDEFQARETAAKIVLLTQMRDAIRGVSPRLFKNLHHREDLLMVLIEAIDDLDDLLEDEEEEEDSSTQKGYSVEDTIE